jgi:hypothetical protein
MVPDTFNFFWAEGCAPMTVQALVDTLRAQ